MNRIKNLNQYQQFILLLLILMALIFTVTYTVISSRVGFLYKNTIFVPTERGTDTVYIGTIQGVDCCFTVTPERSVTFRYGKIVYGPYTAAEDPTAVPDESSDPNMTGVELKDRDKIIFRGGVLFRGDSNSISMLVNEDGTSASLDPTPSRGYGAVVDLMKPPVSTILELMYGPELTHKGEWFGLLLGMILSIHVAVSILYGEEILRRKQIVQHESGDIVRMHGRFTLLVWAPPPDMEIYYRCFGWTIEIFMILFLYSLVLH